MKILVTERDLMHYRYFDNENCAVARALKRRVKKGVEVTVGGLTVILNDTRYSMSSEVLRNMKFIKGNWDTPFYVEIDAPKSLFKTTKTKEKV